MKPFEGVVQIAYDICFATDIKREVKDGKVSYKVSYMENNPIRPLFDFVKDKYTSIKKFGQEHVSRKVDKGTTFLEKYVNEYLYRPLLTFYDKNKTLSWCLGFGIGYLLI